MNIQTIHNLNFFLRPCLPAGRFAPLREKISYILAG